jgi:hypothetical protein
MGFTVGDGLALKKAEQAGFKSFAVINDETTEWPVHRFACIEHPQCTDPAQVLRDAMEAADRNEEKTTVWLDVEAQSIPPYLLPAIQKLGSYPLAIVVTHAGLCTHGPNAGLTDPVLQAVLATCGRGGARWHPILNRLVICGSHREPRTAK